MVIGVNASSPASLVEQLATTLPRGTSAAQTRRLVRAAVRRARREGMQLSQQLLVELLSEECAEVGVGAGRGR